MRTVNIALIWDLLFEGDLMITSQHIFGSLIKDETKNICGDTANMKYNLVTFQIIISRLLISNSLKFTFVCLLFHTFLNTFNYVLWLFILSLLEVVSDPIFSHLDSGYAEKIVDLWSDDHLDVSSHYDI